MVEVQTQLEIFCLGSHFWEGHATWHINNWAAMTVLVTLNQKHTHEAKARETVGGWGKQGNTEQKGGVLWQP